MGTVDPSLGPIQPLGVGGEKASDSPLVKRLLQVRDPILDLGLALASWLAIAVMGFMIG